jgi:hypothetical protein
MGTVEARLQSIAFGLEILRGCLKGDPGLHADGSAQEAGAADEAKLSANDPTCRSSRYPAALGCDDPGCDNKEVPAKRDVEPHVGSRKPYRDYESPWNDIHVPMRPAPHDFVRPDVRRPPLDADK